MSKPFIFIRFFLMKVYFKFFLKYLFDNAQKKHDKPFLFHSKHDFDIFLDMDHDVDRYFYLDAFENQTIWFYKKILKPGMIVFDVGANIGIFSLIAASCLKNNGEIYAFEPADRAYNTFRKNLELNKLDHVFLYKLGMAAKAGSLTFHVCSDDAYNSIGETPLKEILYTTEIQITSIDEFCDENNIKKIDILKIDTEGAESKVIAGGKLMLSGSSAPVIFCEYNRSVQSIADLNKLEFLLANYGYELYYLRFGILRKFDHKSKAGDIIALKPYHFADHNI